MLMIGIITTKTINQVVSEFTRLCLPKIIWRVQTNTSNSWQVGGSQGKMDFIRVRLNFKYKNPNNIQEWVRYKIKKEKGKWYLMIVEKIKDNLIRSKEQLNILYEPFLFDLTKINNSVSSICFLYLTKEEFEELGIWIN